MAKHSNSLVDKLFEPDDAERFYREEEKNKWYREALCKILDYEIKRLAKAEEDMYTDSTASGLMNSVLYRKALRELIGLMRSGKLPTKGDVT